MGQLVRALVYWAYFRVGVVYLTPGMSPAVIISAEWKVNVIVCQKQRAGLLEWTCQEQS